jgi:hypothetical protein
VLYNLTSADLLAMFRSNQPEYGQKNCESDVQVLNPMAPFGEASRPCLSHLLLHHQTIFEQNLQIRWQDPFESQHFLCEKLIDSADPNPATERENEK